MWVIPYFVFRHITFLFPRTSTAEHEAIFIITYTVVLILRTLRLDITHSHGVFVCRMLTVRACVFENVYSVILLPDVNKRDKLRRK